MTEEAVAHGVRRISVPLPLALRAVNVYLVEGDRGWTLVDSGLHTDDGERALRAGLAEAGTAIDQIERVFVTHLHPDHMGLAGTVERGGAEVVMHAPEAAAARRVWSPDGRLIDDTYAWFLVHGMPAEANDGMREAWVAMRHRVDRVERIVDVADGDLVDLGGRAMRVRWTPGHTDFHAVLVDEADGILFAGDHVLPRITPNVGLYPYSREDPLGDFVGALRSIRELPVRRVLPAHGDPFDDLAGRVDELLVHHAARLDATLAAVGGERDAYAVCRTLFPVLRSAHEERFALAETLAHLRHLQLGGRVREVDGRPVRWAVVG